MAVASVLLLSCSGSSGGKGEDAQMNYRTAAEREYDKLLAVWFYQEDRHTAMWYQGNALDTLIDYVSITQDQEKGPELGGRIEDLSIVTVFAAFRSPGDAR